MDTERLLISLLGSFRATLIEGSEINFEANTARALLAFLVMEAGNPHRRDTLSTLLWPEVSDREGLRNLRQALNRLRNAIRDREAKPPFLEITRQTIRFDVSSNHWLDVDAFQNMIAASKRHRHRRLGACRPCIERLEKAAGLYRGDFAPGLSFDSILFEEWLVINRENLHRQAMELFSLLANHHESYGHYEQAQHYARRQIELEPWHEQAHQQLMRIQALNGQRSEALRQYAICRRTLADELGAEPAHETEILYHKIRAGEAEALDPLLPSSPVSLHNLPAQPTPFVGRETELAQIAEFLNSAEGRLLTLVGPGGIGKTRLALQAAQNELGAFRDGIYFVPLASVSSPQFLGAALAGVLGFSFYGDQEPRAQLYGYLQDKEILLVLDNFEHLLIGGGLVGEILRHAPNVRILAVSRERLNLQGEWLLTVEGLDYPPTEYVTEPDRYSALQLFVQSAQRVQPGFTLSEADMPCIVRICQLVEGLPLAIELAATWRPVLSCREIAQEIQRSLDFLSTSMQDLPERHRSLRRVFDYSWELLSSEEQATLRRMSVFPGSFDRTAAEQVAGANSFVLSSLLQKSLLQRSTAPGEGAMSRYEMHSLLRQYTAEKLASATEEQPATQDRHCAHYLTFLAQQWAGLTGEHQLVSLEAICFEIENVRTAWQRAIAQRKVDELEGALDSLFVFYYMGSWFEEGERTYGQVVESLEGALSGEKATVWGKALAMQSWFLFQLGHHVKARALLQQSLSLLRARRAREELAFCLSYLGAVCIHLGAYDEAKQHNKESLDISHEIDDRYGAAVALNNLGRVAYLLGDYDEAQQRYEASLDLAVEMRNRWSMAFALDYLGQIAYVRGAYDEAKRLFEESLAVRRETQDRRGTALCLNSLGDTARSLGQYADAEQLYKESLDTFEQIGHRIGVVQSLTNLGHMASALGDYDQALTLFLEAIQLASDIQATPQALDALLGLASVLSQTGETNHAFALLTLVRDHTASTQESRADAERLSAELLPRLPSEMTPPDQGGESDRTIDSLIEGILA